MEIIYRICCCDNENKYVREINVETQNNEFDNYYVLHTDKMIMEKKQIDDTDKTIKKDTEMIIKGKRIVIIEDFMK